MNHAEWQVVQMLSKKRCSGQEKEEKKWPQYCSLDADSTVVYKDYMKGKTIMSGLNK